MVKTEVLNERLKRTYSDSGKVIRKISTDEEYTEAIDLISTIFEYEELDKLPEHFEEIDEIEELEQTI